MENISKGTVQHLDPTHVKPAVPGPAAPKKVIDSVKGPQVAPGKGKYPIGYTPTAKELERDRVTAAGKDVSSPSTLKERQDPTGGVKVKEKVKAPPPVPKLLGTISIEMYENIPYKVEFTEVTKGCVGASCITTAWRHMLKAYRVWKGKDAMKEFASSDALEITCEGVSCENTLGPGKHKKFHNKWLCPSCVAKDERR